MLLNSRAMIASDRACDAIRQPALSVAYVSPGWPPNSFPNGVVPYVSTIAGELHRSGHHVAILAHSVAEGGGQNIYDIGRFHAARGLTLRAFDGLRRRLAPTDPSLQPVCRSLTRAVRRAVGDRSVQIIEMEEAFGLSRYIQKSSSLPIIVRLHGPWFLMQSLQANPNHAPFRGRVTAEGEAILEADGISAPSWDVLERTRSYYGLPLENAEVIPNPIPMQPATEHWRLESCDRDLVLFIGRFDRVKAGDVMIDGFARLLESVPRARLCFVGPDRGLVDDNGQTWTIIDYLTDRVPDALRSGKVEWKGQLPHSVLADLRRKALVTVICSRYETFGLTVTEAMALGCPVVATHVGGIPEIVEDGVEGLLCEPGDPGDLAEKLAMTLADPRLAAERGRRAAEKCERQFNPVIVASQTAAFYRRVLARHRASSPSLNA